MENTMPITVATKRRRSWNRLRNASVKTRGIPAKPVVRIIKRAFDWRTSSGQIVLLDQLGRCGGAEARKHPSLRLGEMIVPCHVAEGDGGNPAQRQRAAEQDRGL